MEGEGGSPYSKLSYGALTLCSVVLTHRGQTNKPRYVKLLAETHSFPWLTEGLTAHG